ncbi:hypothetical protein AB0E25_08650 [Streptomyces bobili]|uniref:hypothetical protein n=1 Tax=Streptomyces bobili TaxID=67280 RepID=UPI0034072FEA
MTKNKKSLVLGTAILALTIGVWFAYQQLFTKGLDHLPAKPCNEGVRRETVIRVLPDTKSAEEGANTTGSGNGFMFGCHIYIAGGSILSGEAQIGDSSQKAWEAYYKSYGRKPNEAAERASSNGIYALSKGNFASVYIPCVPRGIKAYDVSQDYSLITEVRVIGESRSTGLELHQALSDFAYEMTQRAYTLGKCQNSQEFPEKLPRFEER